MAVAVCGFAILCVALVLALLVTVAHHFRVVGELLDRIVVLQGIPPVQRSIPELRAEENEEREPKSNPRDKYLKDKVRFRVGV